MKLSALIICLLAVVGFPIRTNAVGLPSGTTADSRIIMLATNITRWSQLSLSWTGDGAAGGYLIERSSDSVNFVQVGQVIAPLSSYRDTGVIAAKSYFYRLRAYNAAGTSAYSSIVTAVAPAMLPRSVLMNWSIRRPAGLAGNVVTCATVQYGTNPGNFADLPGCQYCGTNNFAVNFVASASTNRTGFYRLKLTEL